MLKSILSPCRNCIQSSMQLFACWLQKMHAWDWTGSVALFRLYSNGDNFSNQTKTLHEFQYRNIEWDFCSQRGIFLHYPSRF